MGIKHDFDTKFGGSISNAYAKINSFNGNKDIVNFDVLVYASVEARAQGFPHLDQLYFSLPYTDGMSLSDLYTHLKAQPAFTGATDSLEPIPTTPGKGKPSKLFKMGGKPG